MGYKYKGTVETDYPFFLEAGFALGGIKGKTVLMVVKSMDTVSVPSVGRKKVPCT